MYEHVLNQTTLVNNSLGYSCLFGVKSVINAIIVSGAKNIIIYLVIASSQNSHPPAVSTSDVYSRNILKVCKY